MSQVSPQRDKWLLIFLAHADLRADSVASVDKEAIHMLDHLFDELMHCCTNDDKYTIYLTISHVKFQHGGENDAITTTGGARIYKVSGSAYKDINELQLVHQTTAGIHEQQDVTALLEIIKLHSGNTHKHSGIVTCGHGSALGIFKNKHVAKPPPDELQLINAPIDSSCWGKYLNADTVAEQQGNMLLNETLAGAVRACLGKVDAVLMMNCYMANLHTAYAFSGCTEYLVAPQGAISAQGFDIAAMVAYLDGDNIATARGFAQGCVERAYSEAFMKKANMLSHRYTETDERALFAMPLDFIDATGRDLHQFIDELNELIGEMLRCMELQPELKYLFKYARRYSFDFSSGHCHMVDIVNWLAQVQYASADVIYSPLAIPFATFLGNAENFAHELSFKKDNYKNSVYRSTYGSVTCNEPTGLSVWFPIREVPAAPFHQSALSARLYNWAAYLTTINNA